MKHDSKHQLGRFLKRTRIKRGLTLRALAGASQLDHWSYIHKLEQGEITSPDPVKLQRLAQALEIEVEDFYALAGYTVPAELPALAPYLRVKYDLPEAASGDVERYLGRLKRRYGERPGRSSNRRDAS
jgi:transcriptional regulator with XRE-family HTH domain